MNAGRVSVNTGDQIGGNYVSKIWSAFTGVELFDDETLLNEVEFRVYEKDEPEEGKSEEDEDDEVEEKEESFWKRMFSKQ